MSSDEFLVPPGPVDGFVRVIHPEAGGPADVPEVALERYQSLGWELYVPLDLVPEEDTVMQQLANAARASSAVDEPPAEEAPVVEKSAKK